MAITNNHRARVDERHVYVDANPILNTLNRFWHSGTPSMIGIGTILLILAVPGFGLFFTSIGLSFLLAHQFTNRRMPLKLPKSSGDKIDVGSLEPGTENIYKAANAITCLGVDRETGLQVWEDSDNERRHQIVVATTGSGKSFMLRFNLMMGLIQTTGIIAIDGKGDIELPLEAISMIRRFLRDDDLRILNFKQGNTNVYAENGEPRTNTFNPFATGSSTYIAEVLKALLSSDDGKSKGDMWQKRAEAMCEIISKMATYKRDHGDFKIRPGTIAEMLELRELCRIYVDKDIPDDYKSSLRNYFSTLPDFDINNVRSYAAGEEFKGKILEQSGYVVMQLQPALQVLSDLYGFIFDTDTPEIDLKDVVINNRILLVLLPAMEQSEGTLRNTGKIILAALKGMIAGELGSKFQGNVKDILSERACSDPAPFKNFFDECGYYAAIPGIEILPARGRGLGFAFQFICQTYTDLEKGGKETADIIWANCNNKQIGKTESETTYNKISERLGESTVMVRENMELRTGDFASERINSDRLAYVKRKRLEMSDLSKLREGQYYYVTNDKLISIQSGDPSIKSKVSEARYNQLIGLNPIPENVQVMLNRDFTTTIARFKANISNAKSNAIRINNFPRLRSIINTYREQQSIGEVNTFTSYQKALYDYSNQESDLMANAASEWVKDIVGLPKGDSTLTDKTTRAPAKNKPKVDADIVATETGVKPNIDNIQITPNDSWSISSIAAAAGNESNQGDSYTQFDYNKPKSFAESERVRMAAYDDDDDDTSSGDGDGLNYQSEIAGEVEHLKLMLEMGNITEDEYIEEIRILEDEAKAILEIEKHKKKDDDSGLDSGFDNDETHYSIEKMPLDQLNAPSDSIKTMIDDNPPDNFYPSEKARSFKNKSTRELMDHVMQEISDKFQVDI